MLRQPTPLIALVVLTALGLAAPTYAKEFHGAGEEFTQIGTNVVINVGGSRVGCSKGIATGIAPFPSANTLRLIPNYSSCQREFSKSPAEVNFGSCQFELHSSASKSTPMSIVPANCVISLQFATEPECKLTIPGGQKFGKEEVTTGGVAPSKIEITMTPPTVSWSRENCGAPNSKGTGPTGFKAFFTGTGAWYE